MTETRKWSAAAAVLIVAIVAAGWFLLVSPKRSDAADLKAQTATQENDNVALQQKLEELKAQQADLPEQRARLAEIASKIPGNPALPSLVRDLTAAGRKVGVSIDSMAPSAPVAVATAAPGVVAPAPAPAASATGTTDTLLQVPLTLKVTGSYFELEQYVNKLEGLKRSFLVTGFNIEPATIDLHPEGALTITINGRVFLSQPTVPAAVTPVAPAASE
jgi:type IV pilus assembly protein PilO